MKSTAALKLLLNINSVWKGKLFVVKIISENDTAMCTKLSYSTTNVKWGLPSHIPEPIFLCNSSHFFENDEYAYVQSCKGPISNSLLHRSGCSVVLYVPRITNQ